MNSQHSLREIGKLCPGFCWDQKVKQLASFVYNWSYASDQGPTSFFRPFVISNIIILAARFFHSSSSLMTVQDILHILCTYSSQTRKTNYIQTWYMYIYTNKHLAFAQVTKTSKGARYTMALINEKDACIVLTESETRTNYQHQFRCICPENQDCRFKLYYQWPKFASTFPCLNIVQCGKLSMLLSIWVRQKFKTYTFVISFKSHTKLKI